MFGSPTGSTPFGKFRGSSSVTSASMSFGQQSAAKRKRDQMLGNNELPVKAIKLVRKNNSLSLQENEECKALLYPFGALILRREQTTHLMQNVLNSNDLVTLNKNIDMFGEVQCGIGPSDSTDIISCTSDGSIILLNVSIEGTQTILTHKLQLKNENEQISTICHAGNVVILGTSHEELYLIRRYGRTLNADLLQRNRSLFANLFTSSVRFMGISTATTSQIDNNMSMIKIIPVPMSCLLIAVGSKKLSIWTDWTNPGTEEIVWEQNLLNILTDDISHTQQQKGQVAVLDACLMQIEAGAERGTLLLLSAYYSNTSIVSDIKTAKLWLHTLEIELPANASMLGSRNPVTIMHRLLVADKVDYHIDTVNISNNTSVFPSARRYLKPSIHNLSPSWRVFIAWSAVSSNSQGETARNTDSVLFGSATKRGLFPGDDEEMTEQSTTAAGSGSWESSVHTVYASQIDVLNQSVQKTGESGSSSVSCGAVDSHLPVASVLALSAMRGVDGICVVQTDGQVVALCPSLPARALLTAFPPPASMVRDRQATATPAGAVKTPSTSTNTTHISELSNLLIEASFDQQHSSQQDLQEDTLLMRVKNTFSSCTDTEIVQAIANASARLLSRAATGEHWGGSTANKTDRSGVLTRYQMVHRMVEGKLSSHKRLIDIINYAGSYCSEEVKMGLYRDHQQLLLSAGLAGAVEESQLRLSNSFSEGSSSTATSTTPQQEALRLIALGMEDALTQARGVSLSAIEAQGLSAADVFHSEVKNIYSEMGFIVSRLQAYLNTATTSGSTSSSSSKLVSAHFGVMFHAASVLLSAVQLAAVGLGAEEHKIAATCNTEIRKMLESVIAMLLHCSADQEKGGASTRDTTKVVAVDREGKRVRELCVTALQSYAFEAAKVSAGSVEDMSSDWKNRYHRLKGICSELLLTLGHNQAAFTLSAEHLFCEGLMESAHREPGALQARLEDTLRRHGTHRSTDTMPLATACFLWLEKQHRLSEILALGLTNVALLETFLETRPQLAWMHHLRSGNFENATITAAEHASRVPQVATATTLLSIAKLSGKLATDQSSTTVFTPSTKNNSGTASSAAGSTSTMGFEASLTSLNADLAVLRAQELLCEILPNAIGSRDMRINVTDMVEVVTHALQYQGETTSTTDLPDPQHALYAPNPSELVRAFGLALNLLSMQLDLIDGLLAETTAQEAASSSSDVSTSAMGRQYAEETHREKLSKLQKQQTKLSALIANLWGAVIKANKLTWLRLACYPTLGALEENTMKEECWLYHVIRIAINEVQAGNLREELLPYTEGENNQKEPTLLEKAITASEISLFTLTSEGEISTLPTNQTNNRIIHVIKVCINTAEQEESNSNNNSSSNMMQS